jgi:ribosome-associated toxin RatA of RatAB toxin-antitoxin module
MIKAVINIDAPAQRVFGILTDFPGYIKWIPGCEKCAVISQSGSTVEAELIVNGAKRIQMGMRFEAQPPKVLSFKMTKSKDMKAYSGAYRLMDAADGKGTVVLVELEIDAGFMVPKFMVDRIGQQMVDDIGTALRKHATGPGGAGAAAATEARKPGVQDKPRRSRRILQVTKIAEGYRIWLMGETFIVKN